jgi:small-conductance mechanosensitive channel
MSWIKRRWTAVEADRWTKEDYLTFVISPLVYVLLMVGTALSLLLRWYGFLLLGAGVVLLLLMLWIIDPKLKAISEDYEVKQKHYLEEIEKIVRWEK